MPGALCSAACARGPLASWGGSAGLRGEAPRRGAPWYSRLYEGVDKMAFCVPCGELAHCCLEIGAPDSCVALRPARVGCRRAGTNAANCSCRPAYSRRMYQTSSTRPAACSHLQASTRSTEVPCCHSLNPRTALVRRLSHHNVAGNSASADIPTHTETLPGCVLELA